MRNPFGGRMCRDADPDKISAFEPNDDEGIEKFEANRRDPKANSPCSSAGSARAIPSRLAVALPVDAISSANSGESRPDANVPASRVE
jgi:hypothetical protein